MSRIRVGYSLAIFAVVLASLYLAIFVHEEMRLKVWPWLWIALTAGIGVTHLRIDRDSPDQGLSLQAFLLCLAFTFFFSAILLPVGMTWAQDALGGLMMATLVCLIWVRVSDRRRRRPK